MDVKVVTARPEKEQAVSFPVNIRGLCRAVFSVRRGTGRHVGDCGVETLPGVFLHSLTFVSRKAII